LAVVTGFLLSAGAPADECWPECVKVYRAIDLDTVWGPIGSPSALGIPLSNDLTYAINRHGDVVWFVQDFGAAGGVPIRSFVRVSENKFGLSRLVAYELLPPSSLSDRTVVIATDINDDGWIVGYVGSVENLSDVDGLNSDTGARAVIWRLDLASGSPPLIPAYNAHPGQVLTASGSEATDCSSVLHAVNNDSPPMVAGRVRWDFCPGTCTSEPTVNWTIGFSRCGSLTTTAFGHFGTGGASSTVMDISTSDPALPLFPLAVGYDGADDTVCPELPISTGCTAVNNPADGLGWGFGSATPVVLFELGYPIDRGQTQARGVVTGGQIVGGSALPIGIGQLCRTRASYWASASSAPVNLWDVCGGGDEANQAEAMVDAAGIVPASALAVVGGTIDGEGLLWLDRLSGGWCCSRLSEVTVNAIPSIPDSSFDFAYSHDIAPSGQIIGHSEVLQQIGPGEPEAVVHATILTCVFDLNGDLRVNGADLGILLSNWGTWNDVLDLTCDGFIDGADLGALLAAWTGDELCKIGMNVIDCGCEHGGETTQSTSLNFENAVILAGFSSVASFVEWGLAATLAELESMAMFIAAIMLTNGPVTE